jgi:hypothetical protein
MINENRLQFNRKSLFKILKTIYSFLDLNVLFLHVHLWESVIARHWSFLVVRLYCRILKSNCQNPATAAEFRFTPLVFFHTNQTLKNIFRKIIFLKNNFLENILQQKTFYVETNKAYISGHFHKQNMRV